MKASPSQVRVHWLLGFLAVLHALLLFFCLYSVLDDSRPEWLRPLWVACVILWFVWPLALALHPGQSALRVLLPLGIAAPFVLLWFRFYSTVIGPQVLGLPFGVDASPLGIGKFGLSYTAGWGQGELDARHGRLVLEGYGFGFGAPRAPRFSRDVAKRCGIEFLPTSGCLVNERIVGHAYGRNDVTMAELRRRFPAEVKAVEDEEARWRQSYVDGENVGRTEAEADLRAGRLAIVVDDPERSDDAAFEKWLREKYHVNLKRVNPRADPKTSNNVGGYASGYNRIADAEIERRFGKAADYEIWGEWAKIPQTNPLPH